MGIARVVARFEPVVMAAKPGTAKQARHRCGRGRRSRRDPDRRLLDARHRADLRRRSPSDEHGRPRLRLQRVGRQVPALGQRRRPPGIRLRASRRPHARKLELVLEGGAVISDGEGTLITTEECLLEPEPEPGPDARARSRQSLLAAFGASKVVWLPYGLADDWITDGHVDGVAAFLAPRKAARPDDARVRNTRRGTAGAEPRACSSRARMRAAARSRSSSCTEYPTLRGRGRDHERQLRQLLRRQRRRASSRQPRRAGRRAGARRDPRSCSRPRGRGNAGQGARVRGRRRALHHAAGSRSRRSSPRALRPAGAAT